MNLAIQSRRRQLDIFFERLISATISDEVRSDLAKHGAILICGFVERSVELVIMDKVQHMAHPRIQRFIRSHFRRGTNYDCEAIAQLLDRFDVNWGTKFRDFLKTRDDLVQSMTSAYGLRNSIAHGGEGNQGAHGVKALYVSAKLVVDALEASTASP